MSSSTKSPVFSSPAYWLALGAGVVGIGAAAMQERRGSASKVPPLSDLELEQLASKRRMAEVAKDFFTPSNKRTPEVGEVLHQFLARGTAYPRQDKGPVSDRTKGQIPFSAKSHEKLGRQLANTVSRYANKVRDALPSKHHILDLNNDDDFLASLAIALEMNGKKITPGLLSRLVDATEAYMDTEFQEGDVENADPLVIAFDAVHIMLSQLGFGEADLDYQRIGRRLAAKVKIESDKVRRVLRPDSPVLKESSDADLAALAITLGMTGKKLTPMLLTRLDTAYDHWMSEGGDIEDQDPLVIPLDVVHTMLG